MSEVDDSSTTASGSGTWRSGGGYHSADGGRADANAAAATPTSPDVQTVRPLLHHFEGEFLCWSLLDAQMLYNTFRVVPEYYDDIRKTRKQKGPFGKIPNLPVVFLPEQAYWLHRRGLVEVCELQHPQSLRDPAATNATALQRQRAEQFRNLRARDFTMQLGTLHRRRVRSRAQHSNDRSSLAAPQWQHAARDTGASPSSQIEAQKGATCKGVDKVDLTADPEHKRSAARAGGTRTLGKRKRQELSYDEVTALNDDGQPTLHAGEGWHVIMQERARKKPRTVRTVVQTFFQWIHRSMKSVTCTTNPDEDGSGGTLVFTDHSTSGQVNCGGDEEEPVRGADRVRDAGKSPTLPAGFSSVDIAQVVCEKEQRRLQEASHDGRDGGNGCEGLGLLRGLFSTTAYPTCIPEMVYHQDDSPPHTCIAMKPRGASEDCVAERGQAMASTSIRRRVARAPCLSSAEQDRIISDSVALMSTCYDAMFRNVARAAMCGDGNERVDYGHLRCAIFEDLMERGFWLSNGIQFGADFIVYPGDPREFHSSFVLIIVPWNRPLSGLDLVAWGRLGTAVKKSVLLASVRPSSSPPPALCGRDGVSKDSFLYFTVHWEQNSSNIKPFAR